MAASDNLGQQFPVIHEDEARGNSRPVSHEEFQNLARKGHARLQADQGKGSTSGLDSNWDNIKKQTYGLTRDPWGGATVNASSGKMLADTADEVESKVSADKGFGKGHYAVTVRQPGQSKISVPPHAPYEQFSAAMDSARSSLPQLKDRGAHLGVFHDADEGRIDIDPVKIVHHPHEVEQIGAATHAIGGAYHVESGNGFFPPHVKDRFTTRNPKAG